jgi:hypothetical protein
VSNAMKQIGLDSRKLGPFFAVIARRSHGCEWTSRLCSSDRLIATNSTGRGLRLPLVIVEIYMRMNMQIAPIRVRTLGPAFSRAQLWQLARSDNKNNRSSEEQQ